MPTLQSEFIPAVDRSSRRLLVALHGLGDSPAGYRWMPEALRLPWLNYQLINAPDFYYGGYSWFDIEGDRRPGIDRSRQLLVEWLDHARSQGYRTEDTVLFGFSQGCLMTLETGLRYPHRFAALIGISGFLPEYAQLLKELSPMAKDQRILVTHGTQDPLLTLASVKPQMRALQDAGLNLTWQEYPKAHTIYGEVELALIRQFIMKSFEGAPL
jgi:phospholipase/carboxylesterase